MEVELLPKHDGLVLEILRSHRSGHHCYANEIHREAQRLRPGIGLVTVYRALARLRDAELVREVVLPHADAAVYEPMSPPHAHFHCTVCGRIDDVPYTLPAAVIDEIRSLSGNEIVAEHLTLEGVCEKCG